MKGGYQYQRCFAKHFWRKPSAKLIKIILELEAFLKFKSFVIFSDAFAKAYQNIVSFGVEMYSGDE
jgi:hypothetical protein